MKMPMLSRFLVLAVIDVHSRTLAQGQTGRRTFVNFQPEINNTFRLLGFSGEVLIGDRVNAGVQFFTKELKVDHGQVKVSSSHTSKHNGVTHVYFEQTIDGLPVANGFGNINILKNGQVHSLGSSFYVGRKPNTMNLRSKYSTRDAIKALFKLLNLQITSNLLVLTLKNSRLQSTYVTGITFAKGPIHSVLNYIQTKNGLRLVRKINVDMVDNYFVAFVDTASNKVLFLTDYVFDATYNVVPFGHSDPREGSLRLVVNPEDRKLASPRGWHRFGVLVDFNTTIGNNVFAQANPSGGDLYLNNPRPFGEYLGGTLVFRHEADFSKHPTEYVNASTVQLFYMTNILHDLSYRYGFTEDAGNFQENNFGRGGDGNDAVVANTQQGNIRSSAFRLAPDGVIGQLQMRIFNGTNPEYGWDASYDASIVIHEYTHGISGRLTGGRKNIRCLAAGESLAMNEGWSDIFARMFLTPKNGNSIKPFYIGTYRTQTDPRAGPGLRWFPYTSDMIANPSTYADTVNPYYKSSHSNGAVWAALLNEVYWNLIEKHGFQKDWYKTNASEAEGGKLGGNVIFAQLLIDGMKLQPCAPNFIQARDAIIEADWINNNGDNFDEIWTGFAKRGLGIGAAFPGLEDFTKPTKPARSTKPRSNHPDGGVGVANEVKPEFNSVGITLLSFYFLATAKAF